MGKNVEEMTPEEMRRYSRHLLLPEVGLDGQAALGSASVLLIGAGGLGSPVALYLAAAGVGRIGLVDFDVVDESNLQRQPLHHTSDVGRSKLQSAREKIRSLNPHVACVCFEERLTAANALEIISGFDLVIDGTDNFPTRYLVNDACVLSGKPNVYGSVYRFEGQMTVFDARKGPCYRCLYPEAPPPGLVPSCSEAGVLGVLPGVIGLLQATEAVKLILGRGRSMIGRLLLYDALGMEFREIRVRKAPDCPICGEHATRRELIEEVAVCGVAGEEDGPSDVLEPLQLKQLMDSGAVQHLIDVREPYEYTLCRIPGSVLIPQGEVLSRLSEIPRTGQVVILCRSGIRSRHVIERLKAEGYGNLYNLSGGILAWGREVDPTIEPY